MTAHMECKIPFRVIIEKRERTRTYSDEINTPKQMRRCDSAASTISSQNSDVASMSSNGGDSHPRPSISSYASNCSNASDQSPGAKLKLPRTRLEDLITCPIHLGMMEDPRILPCGHAFCLSCLAECVRSKISQAQPLSSVFICPICRSQSLLDQSHDLSSLPPSLAHKQLTDYIVEKHSQYFLRKYSLPIQDTSGSTDPGVEEAEVSISPSEPGSLINSWTDLARSRQPAESVEQKRELIRHLIREISQNKSSTSISADEVIDQQIDSIIREMESPPASSIANSGADPHYSRAGSIENGFVNSLNNLELFSSNYELMDVETIRENMKKYSEYKLQRDPNRLFLPINNHSHNGNGPSHGGGSSKSKIFGADVKMVNNEPDAFVWICSNQHSIIVRSADNSIYSFKLKLDSGVMKPFHVRICDDELMVSGNTDSEFGLVTCSMRGIVLRKAVFNGGLYGTNCQIAGFHISVCRSRIYVCLPTECKIVMLDNFTENSRSYHFADLHPTYVTQNSDHHEIWASCPQDGRILIIDEETGSYRQLGTNQIYNAIPSHITITSDNRVLFLDCHQNRVFWVRKRNEFILIQRITFSGHHNKQLNAKIQTMVAVSGPDCSSSSSLPTSASSSASSSSSSPVGGRLLFSTINRTYLVKPAKTVDGTQNHKHIMCTII